MFHDFSIVFLLVICLLLLLHLLLCKYTNRLNKNLILILWLNILKKRKKKKKKLSIPFCLPLQSHTYIPEWHLDLNFMATVDFNLWGCFTTYFWFVWNTNICFISALRLHTWGGSAVCASVSCVRVACFISVFCGIWVWVACILGGFWDMQAYDFEGWGLHERMHVCIGSV